MAKKSTAQIYAEFALAKGLLMILSVMPRGVALAFGSSVAWLGHRTLSKLRRAGARSLEIAYPELSESERARILEKSFQSLGRTMGVVGGFHNVRRENIEELIETDFDDEFTAQFAQIREQKRGFIVLTGHIGNWELFALAYSMYFGPASLLSRKMDNPKIDEMVLGIRSSFGNRQIDKANAAAPILRILNRGEAVGILADVNTHPKEGVFVPFFGVDACTTAGVAMLAHRTGAAIVPLFAVWNEAKGKYSMINEKIIEPVDTGDRKADIVATTAKFTAALERVIRKYPDQWIWIHRRWKTRPLGEREIY